MSPTIFRKRTIRSEKMLGERFEAARKRLKLTFEEAEKATRVRAKYLTSLEEGRFDLLPEDVYTFGFIERYAGLLELNPATCIKQYQGERSAATRLGWIDYRKTSTDQLIVGSRIREARVMITPKLFWSLTSVVMIVGIAGYLWYQVNGFMAAPELEVATPAPDLAIAEPTIEIEGRADGHAVVTINAEPIALSPDGSFKQVVYLERGVNTIEIAAKNRLNKETKKQLRVLANY